MRCSSLARCRTAVRLIAPALALAVLVTACSDGGDEGSAPVDSTTPSSLSPTGDDSATSDPSSTTDPASTSTDTTETTESAGTDPSTATTVTSPPGPPLVRVGQVTIERTDPCPDRTVAPTFNLTMTSDAGTESVPPEQATQIVIGEASPTDVAPAATFTVQGEWSLNVQMLEHLTGTTRGTTHTEASRLTDRISIDGQPVDISWAVTQDGSVVEFSGARFVISPSCVQIQPGTSVIFTDGSVSQTAGSTDPAFDQPRDLPLGQPMTIFDGASFQAASAAGWSLKVNVLEHWNGRLYDSAAHTDSVSVADPVAPSNPGDQAWVIRYDLSLG